MRTALAVMVAAAVGAAAAGGAAWFTAQGTATATQDPADEPTIRRETAAVTRETLTATEELDATLGYAGESLLSGGLTGTYTWLPQEGAVLEQGDVVAEVDGTRRVALLYGRRPAWRTLRRGSSGADVRQLEEALDDLGHLERGDRPDGRFDLDTRAAVRRWQRDLDVREDGIVDLGEVIFVRGPVRIATLEARLGGPAAPAAAIATTTSARRVVTLELDADRQDILAEGDSVDVELPDGTRTPGTVTDVDDVATASGGGEPQVIVTVTLTDPAATGTLDGAPVTVHVTRQRREDVLTVPVDALLALREGGYAVELAEDDGDTRLVGVDLGLFADGRVQVEGSVAEGDQVVVPR